LRLRLHPGSDGNVQDLVGHEDSSAASKPEDAKFECSWGVIIDSAVDAGFGDARRRRCGNAGRCGVRGNSITHWKATPRERRFGATRSFTFGAAGRCRMRGNPKPHRQAILEERRRGSVRALRREATIPLGRALLRASRDQPGRRGGNAPALGCTLKQPDSTAAQTDTVGVVWALHPLWAMAPLKGTLTASKCQKGLPKHHIS
jgi:hypothetical protein